MKGEEYINLLKTPEIEFIDFVLECVKDIEQNISYEELCIYPSSEFKKPPEILKKLIIKEIRKNNVNHFINLNKLFLLEILKIQDIELIISDAELILDKKILNSLVAIKDQWALKL